MTEAVSQLETLFQAAIQIDSPAARAEYLETVCGDDNELKDRVEALLGRAKQ